MKDPSQEELPSLISLPCGCSCYIVLTLLLVTLGTVVAKGFFLFFFFLSFSWSCRQVGPVCIARDLRLGFFSNSHGQSSS